MITAHIWGQGSFYVSMYDDEGKNGDWTECKSRSECLLWIDSNYPQTKKITIQEMGASEQLTWKMNIGSVLSDRDDRVIYVQANA